MTTNTKALEVLTRPIVGIENRTPLEVFDIMCDRIRSQDTNLARMREALREMKFQLLWRADGMAVEQARIHADAWANEVFARQALAERGRG